ISYSSARRASHRDRSRTWRPDPRSSRHLALVRSVRRSQNPGHSPLPGQGRMDASLYGQRCRQQLRACLPWSQIFSAADRCNPLLPSPLNQRTSTVLLDVEGTPTPIDFVYKVLFPFALAHAEQFLKDHISAPDVLADLEALRQEHIADAQQNLGPPAFR